MMKIAVLGYGTIGSGIVEVLEKNQEAIRARVGTGIEVKYVLDLRDFPGDPIQDRIVYDYNLIVNDPEICIVAEAMGGVEPAFTFASQALRQGKHFCTSNKALIADKGAELIRIGRDHNTSVLFEASVGGGIPIIRPLNTCLTAEVIEEITGILNGTTNYMLTRMSEDGLEFADVLKDAQEKGYAEADPTADIEGYDACRKIAILTSLVAGQQVDFGDIPTEGITGISAADIRYAAQIGGRIKLLATSRRVGDSYTALVAPYVLFPSHPLYSVNDVFNAVFVRGNMLGDSMFYGAGAGKLPTASAVVADIVDIARNIDSHIEIKWAPEKLVLADTNKLICRNLMRVDGSVSNTRIEEAFGEVEYLQTEVGSDETVYVSPEMDGDTYEAAVAKLGDGLVSCIRIA